MDDFFAVPLDRTSPQVEPSNIDTSKLFDFAGMETNRVHSSANNLREEQEETKEGEGNGGSQ